MGDLNAVDLTQAVHEQVLIDSGGFKPDEDIKYGHPTPESDTWEGLYIDDHIITQVVDRQMCPRARRPKERLRDEELLQASRDHYIAVGLPRSEAKAFEGRYKFVAWGTEVDSCSGRVGVPIGKLLLICDLVVGGLCSVHLSKNALQQLLGQFPHPWMHRRELSCSFQRIYKYVQNLSASQTVRLPALIHEELLVAGLLLSLAHSNIRWPISNTITSTDATVTHGGDED